MLFQKSMQQKIILNSQNHFFEEEAVALKFQEIAKSELSHHKFDMDIIRCKINEKIKNEEPVLTLENSLLYDVYEDWFREVESRVNNFKVKK